MKANTKNTGCKPARYQKGDKVFARFQGNEGEHGVVTAVGCLFIKGELAQMVYRVGRNQYWNEWQLQPSRQKKNS